MSGLSPEISKQVLDDFLVKAEGSEPIKNFDELKSIITPKVTTALAAIILENGLPAKYPESGVLAILESKEGRRKVKGLVQSGDEDNRPHVVYLAEYKRDPLRFKRTKSIVVSVGEGVNIASFVYMGEEFYRPQEYSDESIARYRDEVRDSGHPYAGIEKANKLIRNKSRVLNAFLEVTASITRDLVEVVPTS